MGIQDLLRDHPAVGGLVGGAVIGAGSTAFINVITGRAKSAKKKTTRKRTSKTTTKRKTSKKPRTSSRKSPSKKIYRTKNGQPYIKLASGKARFISKKSAKLRKKRKGGYY